MILKLGMQHVRLKLYKVYINDDPALTVTDFTARSNSVALVCVYILKTVTNSISAKFAANHQSDRRFMFI